MAGVKKINKKVVKATTNIHVVMFSCPNCSHETEEVKFCSECGKPMKVINVIEKFGNEADEFLEKLRKNLEEGTITVTGDNVEVSEDEAPTIIKLSEEDHIKEDKEENSGALGVIFPDDDQSNISSEGVDIDFMDALEKLDEEEEEPGEFNELPEL